MRPRAGFLRQKGLTYATHQLGWLVVPVILPVAAAVIAAGAATAAGACALQGLTRFMLEAVEEAERGHAVGPPPAESGGEDQADEEGRGHVGAGHGTGGIAPQRRAP